MAINAIRPGPDPGHSLYVKESAGRPLPACRGECPFETTAGYAEKSSGRMQWTTADIAGSVAVSAVVVMKDATNTADNGGAELPFVNRRAFCSP